MLSRPPNWLRREDAPVHPQDASHQGLAVLIDRDGALALGRAAQRAHVLALHKAALQQAPGGGNESRPPLLRGLLRTAIRCEVELHGLRFPAQHAAGRADQRDLHAGGAEIDCEVDGFGHARLLGGG
jgi:hypothetical protein